MGTNKEVKNLRILRVLFIVLFFVMLVGSYFLIRNRVLYAIIEGCLFLLYIKILDGIQNKIKVKEKQ